MNVKKVLLAAFIFFTASQILFSQELNSSAEDISQVLIPRQVFLGDTAQLQYSFTTPEDIFSEFSETSSDTQSIKLDFSSSEFDSLKEKCTIIDASLVRSGITYIITVSFIPWKTGTIEFPQFNLFTIAGNKTSVSSHSFIISFQSITIESLAEKTDSTALCSPSAPVTLPETNYILWLLIASIVFFILLCAFLIAKSPKIASRIKKIKQSLIFLNNRIFTKLRLFILSKNKKISDTDFCISWQKIIRSYLTLRLAKNFYCIPSSGISKAIYSSFYKDTEEFIPINFISSLSLLFKRTDYIKFAAGSIDSRLQPESKYKTSLSKNERSDIINETVTSIQILETSRGAE